MEWYWWIVIIVIAAAIIWPLKIKLLKKWSMKNKEKKEKQAEDNDQ